MARIAATQVVRPAEMSASARAEFARKLYSLHDQIFSGVSLEKFVGYVVESPAPYTLVKLYLNTRGEWIGYCAVHGFDKQLGGRGCHVLRAEAGLLPQYRGTNATLYFGFVQAMRYKLSHPWRRLYYLGTFVHPSVYHLLAEHFWQLYPRCHRRTPPAIEAFMIQLADAFSVARVDAQRPLVRDVGWITREPDDDRQYWRTTDREDVRFYVAQNPGYTQGHGLVTLVPLTFRNILLTSVRFVRHKLARTRHRSASL